MPIDHPSTTLLFIDNHDDDRQYWVQRLRMSSPDYVILEASTGKSGLAICRSQRVECIISELTLPDMSGFDVLLQVVPKPRHPEIAFIFLTRLILAPMKDLALNNGAQAYLVKSHSSGDELDNTIHKALASVAPTRKESALLIPSLSRRQRDFGGGNGEWSYKVSPSFTRPCRLTDVVWAGANPVPKQRDVPMIYVTF